MISNIQVLPILLVLIPGALFATVVDETMEMCDAQRYSGRKVQLRGLGRSDEHGFLLSDGSCPIISTKGSRIPLMIRVGGVEFIRSGDRRLFEKLQDQMEKPLLQIVLRGRLICKTPLSIAEDTENSSNRGDGFGVTGLVACRIDHAEVLGAWTLVYDN